MLLAVVKLGPYDTLDLALVWIIVELRLKSVVFSLLSFLDVFLRDNFRFFEKTFQAFLHVFLHKGLFVALDLGSILLGVLHLDD